METLHTFEGTDLSEVLVQVHKRLGADAEIDSAAKVRRGGVAGFFTKQVFVVKARSMKAPDIAPRAARHIADEPGGVLAALLAMADERSEQERPVVARATSAERARTASSAQGAAGGNEQRALPAASIDAHQPAADRAEPAAPSPSYDSIFERALAMSEQLQLSDEVRRHDEGSRLDETHGFDRRASLDLADALVDVSDPDEGVVDLTRLPARRRGGLSPRPPADRRDDGAPPRTAQRRIRPAADVLPHVDRSGRVVRPGATATIEPSALLDVTDRSGSMTRAHVAPVQPAPIVVRRHENVATLLALGLPREFCEVDELTVRALSAPLETLPFAPAEVEQATGVIAVVGGMPKVRRLSTYLAADATLACREMPRDLAAWLWIPDAGEARHRRSRWSWRERAVVVGVEGSPASSLRAFSMEMLRNLAPTSLRIIVEAAWSLDAMHHWTDELATLGVPMALDVVGVEDAAEPASVLQLGLPVATLDGLPATAQRWASILVERIGEDER